MKELLRFFSDSNKKYPFYISLAGVTYPDSSYSITRKVSTTNVIEYVTEGEGYVLADGCMHHVCSDTIYILNKGEPHKYYDDERNPFKKIFMNISGIFFDEIISAYGIKGVHFFKQKDLKPTFEKIVDVISSKISDSEKQAKLQGIFLEIVAVLSGSQIKEKHSDEAMILKDYIDSHTKNIVSTKELAGVIYRSGDYCLKLFKREFGVTPYTYQIESKIRIAKNLLENTSMSIGSIAETLGYSDMHYFSNLFYSKCGIRPLAYRKNKK